MSTTLSYAARGSGGNPTTLRQPRSEQLKTAHSQMLSTLLGTLFPEVQLRPREEHHLTRSQQRAFKAALLRSGRVIG